jgi:diadenosine tetraphosphate (Ap4A) HIT family hydrolase
MKRLFFLDGSYYDVEEPYCRGCFMNHNEHLMPFYIYPVFERDGVVVRQDAEWPIPGFYIISIREHIGSFDCIDAKTRAMICELLFWIRKGIREKLGVERAQIYHEEKISSPHFHIWILPLWEDIMSKTGIQPKIYESNIKQYIDSFHFEETKGKILKCNEIMKEFLNTVMTNG